MKRLEFRFPIRAIPHQSVKFSRGRTYQPKKITDYKKALVVMLKEQLPFDFKIIPAGTPIVIQQLTYQFEYPKLFPKKKRTGNVPKTTKPDLQDNINKAFLDAFEGVLFEQDQNIHTINKLSKCMGDENLITLIIEYEC